MARVTCVLLASVSGAYVTYTYIQRENHPTIVQNVFHVFGDGYMVIMLETSDKNA